MRSLVSMQRSTSTCSTIHFSRVQRNQKPQCVTPRTRQRMSNTSWAYRSRGDSGENRDDNGGGGKTSEGANKVLDAEEQLTNELFGTSNFLSRAANSGEMHGDESDGDESDDGKAPGTQNGGGSLFYEDLGVSEEPTSTSVFTTTSSVKRKKVPAWQDEDDEDIRVSLTSANRLRKLRKIEGEDEVSGTEYTKRLREQHKKMQNNNSLSWAKLPSSSGPGTNSVSVDDDDEEATGVSNPLQTSNALIDTSLPSGDTVIPSDILKIERLADANKRSVSKSTIQSVRFSHVTPQLMLTAGFDKTLRLFSIDGKKNPKVQSVFIRDMPITTAEFLHANGEIVLAGRRPFFYTYDLESGNMIKVPRILGRKEKSFERFTISPDGKYIAFVGNNGYIVLVSGKTKQWVANLKMNGSVRSLTFAKNSTQLISSGDKGEIYVWDMKNHRCLYRHQDHGCLHSTAIAAVDNYYACGSGSGVVNLYENKINGNKNRGILASAPPLPTKSIMSLTTRTDVLRFNSDETLLAIASQMKKDSFKILHVPSRTVYSNWPTAQTPLHYVTSVDFSVNSGMLAIGNDRGKVLLYRLKHYHSV